MALVANITNVVVSDTSESYDKRYETRDIFVLGSSTV
jgi:hypothetical protein